MKYKSILLFVSAVMVCLCCSSLGIANEEASASSPTVPAEQSAQNPEQAQPAPAQPAPVPQPSTPVPAEKNSVQQDQASAQDGAEESAFKSIWFWIALALLILVICIKFRIHCSALSRASGRVSGIEETPEASSNPTGKWSEYLTILDGERFRPGEELFEKSVEKAQKQAQTFIDTLKEKMIDSPDGLNTIPVQEELQALANSLHPKFVESICSPSSYWMKKTFPPEKSAPSDLAKLMTHFFRPFQAPVGAQIQLEIPAWVIAVLVVTGAVLGSILTGLFTRLANMNGPSDFVTFIGATAGAAVFASGIFWITANEKYRKRLERYVLVTMGADTVFQLVKYFSPFEFFKSKRIVNEAYLKRICVYLSLILVLMMTKRKNSFNYTDYLHKLEPLYLEQIQGIVLFVSSLNQSDILFDEKWKDAESQWKKQEASFLKKIDDLQAIIEGSEPVAKHMRNAYNYFCDLWKADIHNLEPILHNMALQFKKCGYTIPDDPMKFVGQIDGPRPGDPSTPIVGPVETPPTAVWSQDMENQYDIFGLPPDDGDLIEIIRKPVIRNGAVEEKGAAKRKR